MNQRIPQRPTRRHHYIPVFYTRQWATDGSLLEYRRVNGRKLVSRRTAPDGTGYREDLYTIQGLEGREAQQVEDRFFQQVDNDGAAIVAYLTGPQSTLRLHPEDRTAWTTFMMSVLYRTPEDVDRIRRRYRQAMTTATPALQARWEKARRPEDPPDFQTVLDQRDKGELDLGFFNGFVQMMRSPMVEEVISRMVWQVFDLSGAPLRLLTSDRPVIRSNGLKTKNGYMAMPLSPRHLFIATKDLRVMRGMERIGANQLVRQTNMAVVCGAERFVYARDDDQRLFVERHMGSVKQPRLAEVLDVDLM